MGPEGGNISFATSRVSTLDPFGFTRFAYPLRFPGPLIIRRKNGIQIHRTTSLRIPEDDETRLRHYNDMKHTSLMLFNKIVDALRNMQRGDGRGFSWIDTVLETSKIIEETTLMREQMRADEARYKQDLFDWHCSDEGKVMYRIPNKVKTFAQFRNKKSCKVKDYAIEVVTKMYRLDQINRKQMQTDFVE